MSKQRLLSIGLMIAMTMVAPALLASAGHGESPAPEVQESITSFDSPLVSHMLWEWIAFGLLFVVLLKIGFPWMFKQMDARQTRIREALEKADKVRAEAETLLQKHEKMMAESHAEAKRITDEALKSAQKVKDDIVGAAQAEATAVVERAKKEIGMIQNKASDELRKHAIDLSLQASSAVLKRSLNDDDHRRLASEAIDAAEKAMAN